ncbi:MAG: DUF1553 domain-containing protein [Verrucomicrobiales bacterium]
MGSLLFACSPALAEVDFGKQIRPILSDRCYFCHGPDADDRKADLRLDTEEGARSALGGGMSVIAPGDLEHSEVFQRITSDDPDEKMPPPKSNLSLTPEEIALIAQWIEEGAKYEKHWSFVSLAEVPVPAVKDPGKWARGEIDRFVLAQLEALGLQGNGEASGERLIRRVSFDLTGLPPTLEEIDTFMTDQSEGGYAAMVERYLAKPAYGERMASEWMDVARYSDSYGYQVDRDRRVWPWRDWVIKAFNENLPYDEFMTWQLAGDLLPDATDEQVLATTFNRLHPQKVEGGSVAEEFRVEYVADRSHTAGTAFMGLTLECSRCHDHKYDPITQKEYYELFAFFNNIDEAGLYSYFTPSVPTPTLPLGGARVKENLDELEAKVTSLEEELGEMEADVEAPDDRELVGLVEHLDFEDFKPGANQAVAGKVGQGVELTGDDAIQLKSGNFPRWQPFSVSLWMKTPDLKDRAVVYHRSKAWTDAASRGYELLIEDGKLSAALIHFYPGNAIRVRASELLKPGEWAQVTVTYDGSSRADGLRIYVGGKLVETEVIRDHLTKQITGGGGDNISIGERMRDRGFKGGGVDEFRVYERELTPVEVAQLHDGVSLERAEGTALQSYLASALDPAYRAKLDELRSARQAFAQAQDKVEEIMVMRELDERRPSYVLERGAYDARGEQVEPGVPAWLNPLPSGAGRDRLGLARWLTDPANPLAARVAVNRYWQLIFGEGLVRTPNDFGSQGALPTHPELLDWLAKDFIDHGWDVKRLLKQMVMSATYRQRSEADQDLLARDPENLLLARAPVYRLPAEMLRDQSLAVSGLLVEKLGGASVRPYEVAVSFKPVEKDTGEGLYRRSLYTYWKRTGPAPVMMALDASKRDVCSVKRERTASPLQALVLLNDPQIVEAARVLGEKLVVAHGDDAASLVRDAFRRTVGRSPRTEEAAVVERLYREQLALFEGDLAAAGALLSTGDAPRDEALPSAEVAAAAIVVNGLLNFDASVMKR